MKPCDLWAINYDFVHSLTGGQIHQPTSALAERTSCFSKALRNPSFPCNTSFPATIQPGGISRHNDSPISFHPNPAFQSAEAKTLKSRTTAKEWVGHLISANGQCAWTCIRARC